MENTLGKSKLKVIKDRELKYDGDESRERDGESVNEIKRL